MARFGRDMVIYASADLLGSSIGLVLSPVFTRLFTPEQYGAQAALGAVWGFVALAQYGGMDSAYPNFRSRTSDETERRRVLVSATWMAVVSALAVAGLFGVISLAGDWMTGFAGVSRRELLLYLLTLAPGGIMAWFLFVLRYERRAAAFARVSLLGRVAGALVLIPVLLLVPQQDRMWVGFLVSAVVAVLAAGLGWRELTRQALSPFARPAYDSDKAAAMLRFGLVLVPAGAVYAASTVMDRLLVTGFSGPAETATLALALRLGAVATMLRTWFALVWDPQLMEWIPTLARDALLQRLQDAASLIARAVCLLVCLASVWTEPVVKLLYPSDYWSTIPLVPWIVLGVGASALSLVAGATTTIARIAKLHLPVYALGLMVNLGVGCWWIPKLGAGGAVAGALAGEVCILVSWILLGTRLIKNLPLNWRGTLLMLGATAGFVAVYRSGFALPTTVWAERIAVSVVVGMLLGLPLARRIWANRKQFLP